MDFTRTSESSKFITKKRLELRCTTLEQMATLSSSVWSMIDMAIRSTTTLPFKRISKRSMTF
jgi:hypothetical protein